MGFLDSFKQLLGNVSSSNCNNDDEMRYPELIRLVSFAQKVKPLMGGSHGIYVTYFSPPSSEHKGGLWAEFNFYDFNYVYFAHKTAYETYSMSERMVQHYYDLINKEAGITSSDWPYGIDKSNFIQIMRREYPGDSFSLIPNGCDASSAKFRVFCGATHDNARKVYKSVIQVCKTNFPNLTVDNVNAGDYSFYFKITI